VRISTATHLTFYSERKLFPTTVYTATGNEERLAFLGTFGIFKKSEELSGENKMRHVKITFDNLSEGAINRNNSCHLKPPQLQGANIGHSL
jgi:hypothetical protein